eukprot:6196136-Pleurochrysis_carterae.AAC.2
MNLKVSAQHVEAKLTSWKLSDSQGIQGHYFQRRREALMTSAASMFANKKVASEEFPSLINKISQTQQTVYRLSAAIAGKECLSHEQ